MYAEGVGQSPDFLLAWIVIQIVFSLWTLLFSGPWGTHPADLYLSRS